MVSSDTITLTLPADADLRPVVRHVLGGIGARFDLSLERVDDLQLAVAVILERTPSTDIVLQAEITAEGLVVGVGPFDHDITSEADIARLLTPLIDELRSVERDEGDRYVELELRRREDR
jgi:hypothetical protein